MFAKRIFWFSCLALLYQQSAASDAFAAESTTSAFRLSGYVQPKTRPGVSRLIKFNGTAWCVRSGTTECHLEKPPASLNTLSQHPTVTFRQD
jgi:hypothetical protein